MMFVTSDQPKAPRVFQKPNILRKKPKCQQEVTRPDPVKEKEAAGIGREGKHQCSKTAHGVRKPGGIQLDTYMCEEYRKRKLHGATEPASKVRGSGKASRQQQRVKAPPVLQQLHDVSEEVEHLNVQIMLTSHLLADQLDADITPTEQTQEQLTDFHEIVNYSLVESEAQKCIGEFTIKLPSFVNFNSINNINMVPDEELDLTFSEPAEEAWAERCEGSEALAARADERAEQAYPGDPAEGAGLARRLAAQHAVLFECEREGCRLVFASAEALGEHRASHAAAAAPAVRQVMLDCPARRRHEPYLCESVFQSREHLVRHLKEDHTEEDAVYKCNTCDRTFFWCSGLRAHMRTHDKSARTIYACLWPECKRVFLQACRLKEHSRQHTGDKPYPCLYPSCGWAFRTASKLLRHARRHTGERRFTCRLCARAFLRAEHLREHEARHTNPQERHKHRCTHPGCEQRFSNKSSLYLHTKKLHPPPAPQTPPLPPQPVSPIMDFLSASTEVLFSEPSTERDEFQAARTHITWPIPPGAHLSSADAWSDSDTPVYTLAPDAPQQARESSVYSDLFLHGDTILQHDDTQQCLEAGLELVLLAGGGGGEGGGGYAADALHLDSDLALLDSTTDPINHLLQEELMLAAESCADESPFHVLLLSGEDSRPHLT